MEAVAEIVVVLKGLARRPMQYYMGCAMEFEIRHLPDQDPQPLLDEIRAFMHEKPLPAMHAVDPPTGFQARDVDELIKLSASEAVELLRGGEVTPLEMVDAAAARIEATNPHINALPTLCLDRARDHARRLMADRPGPEDPARHLSGLPIAVKDLVNVAGVRTTLGSTIFADHVPARSDILVENLERRGAIVIAKANTPEFGHGANTFNEVFGKTRNPWNTALTSGGSSGGSAAALATGQVWLATGSDLGCSLRTPAAFCSVVGLRPSPGRVAVGPRCQPIGEVWDTLNVEGSMGRTVADVALMLDAQAVSHPMDPMSLPPPSAPFGQSVAKPKAPKRVAFSPDLGVVPVDPELKELCSGAAQRFAEHGASVEEACPDLSDAREIFHVLRAHHLVGELAPVIDEHRDKIKPEVIWNFEEGLKLNSGDITRAERARAALYYRVVEFFRSYDLLLTPATAVAPFDVDERYVTEVAGQKLDTYYDWYWICYAITITSCPALSVPCGFTASGLPVGLQMVGPPRGEAALLGAAAMFEDLMGIAGRLPVDPRPGRD